MFSGFNSFNQLAVDPRRQEAIDNHDHPELKEFLLSIIEDETTSGRCLYSLTENYVTTTKQFLGLNMTDYHELQFPMGLRKKLHKAVEEYLDKLSKSEDSIENNQYFSVDKKNDVVLVTIKNAALRQNLQNLLAIEEIFKPEPIIPVAHFLRIIPQLQSNHQYLAEDESLNKEIKNTFKNTQLNQFGFGFSTQNNGGGFNAQNPVHHLLKYLYTVFRTEMENIKNMVDSGYINFESLWYLFQPQSKAVTLDKAKRKNLEGFKVSSTSYSRGYYSYFMVNLSHIASNGKFFSYLQRNAYIHHFEGTKKITELEIMPLKEDSEQFTQLMERGKRYAELAVGHHYLEYEGYMTRVRFWTSVDEKADGRVMIDIAAHNKMNASNSGIFGSRASNFGGASLNQAFNGDLNQNSFEKLPEELFWMTPSCIPGFSFVNKRWGQIDLKGLSEIKFQKEAFDLLVLNQHKKDVIKALVTHSDKAFSDFIEHKGKGCIFLLHGPPGVGKTLTAEAIAEYLGRPLYAVSVGELGTKPSTLEKNLSDILELAGIWNAVVLVDEADIFLERRSESDIIRNAMVGVFLRVVEYFSGVLFLTSNRVRCLDRAFHSRVSVALKYPDLQEKSRLKIWHHFLRQCGMTLANDIDLATLAKFDLNGRQIRSTIRLACSLAHNEATGDSELILKMSHISDCVSISNQFEDFVSDTSLTNILDDVSPMTNTELPNVMQD